MQWIPPHPQPHCDNWKHQNESASWVLTVPHNNAYSMTPQLQMSTSGPAYNLMQTQVGEHKDSTRKTTNILSEKTTAPNMHGIHADHQQTHIMSRVDCHNPLSPFSLPIVTLGSGNQLLIYTCTCTRMSTQTKICNIFALLDNTVSISFNLK